MKILVVCQYYYPESFSITSICESLVKRGHQVDVVTGQPNYGMPGIKPGYEKIRYEEINGVHVNRVKIKPRKSGMMNLFKNYISFWRKSKRFVGRIKDKYDVVYSMSLSPVISIVAANKYAKKHKINHVSHILDIWPESPVAVHAIKRGSILYKFLFNWSRAIYRNTDKLLVSSPSFIKYFDKVLGLKDKDIKFVAQPAISKISSEEKSFEKRVNITYAGNIGTIQRLDEFVKAIFLLRDRTDFQMHIFGAGSQEKIVSKMIEERNLGDTIKMHGFISPEELSGYYNKSTAIIVPLENDGSWVSSTIPNKLVTAMSYGKPILASISGDGEKILKETGGAFFSSLNEQSLCATIEKIINADEETLKQMGLNNKKYYDEHFDYENVISQIEAELSSSKN